MEVLELARTYLQENNEEQYEGDVKYISISFTHDSSYCVISGQFPDEQETVDVLPPTQTLQVPLSTEIGSRTVSIFKKICENIHLSNSYIDQISITEIIDESHTHAFTYPASEADASVFVSVSYPELPQKISQTIWGEVYTQLLNKDSSIKLDSIKNVKLWFSDEEQCQLSSAEGKISTPFPHRYYSHVQTIQEYIRKRNTNLSKNLRSQNIFEIDFMLDTMDTEPPEELQTVAETQFMSVFNTSCQTEWEYMLNAESINLGTFEDDLFTKHGLVYSLKIPIVGGNIGETRS